MLVEIIVVKERERERMKERENDNGFKFLGMIVSSNINNDDTRSSLLTTLRQMLSVLKPLL